MFLAVVEMQFAGVFQAKSKAVPRHRSIPVITKNGGWDYNAVGPSRMVLRVSFRPKFSNASYKKELEYIRQVPGKRKVIGGESRKAGKARVQQVYTGLWSSSAENMDFI
ncbi:MAG: hypothetical protein M1835_003861 [Candelina submexicana]|nr:MAG: hypothetical protein M1835_003861 [Candelina submexicana]